MLEVAQEHILFNELCRFLPHTARPIWYTSAYTHLKDKRRGKVIKGVLFLHDNAPAHRSLATQKKLAYLDFQCLDHPPYSPDLAPSDYHLFPERLPFFARHGGHSCRGDLVGRTTNKFFFLSGLQELEQRAKKCIELRGERVE
jgi:histone-lysine N-methyltransferase SETMAR